MTNIEKIAREYALSKSGIEEFYSDFTRLAYKGFSGFDLEEAFDAGVAYALGNQWRDAEKEKPDLEEEDCLCRCKIGGVWQFRVLRWYDVDEEWRDHKGLLATVSRWLPIPAYKPKGE